MAAMRQNPNGGAMAAIALVFQLGLTIAVPAAVGAIGGVWLDGRFHTSPLLTIAGIFLGLAGGLLGAYRMVVLVAKIPTDGPPNA